MRKTLFMVVALSSLLWSGGLAEIWMGDHAHQIALFLIIAGVFLYGGRLFSSVFAFFNGFAFSRGKR